MVDSIGITDGFRGTAAAFGQSGFTTKDFVDRYREARPAEWEVLVSRYGQGGRGSGHPYSANSRVGSMLGVLFRAGDLHRFDYEPAPPEWGNDVIRRWAVSPKGSLSTLHLSPAEPPEIGVTDVPPWADREYVEGTLQLRTHLRRERDSQLPKDKKAAFRAQHGKLFCERCFTVPAEKYGEKFGEAAIEVHHSTVMVSEMGPGHKLTLSDLQCLCANCHRIIHAELRSS